jgi:hypothetical protein
MHGVWKFNNITPSHPSHAVDIFCARPSMAVGWCLQRRLRREKKKKFNALSVDGRVLWYGGWTKEGKKYMGCRNLTI